MLMLKEKQKKIKNVALLAVTIIFLLSGAVFSWSGVWNSLNWFQMGRVVTARELSENLQYLYERISKDSDCMGQAMLRYNKSLNKLECFTCPTGQVVKWINGRADCGY